MPILPTPTWRLLGFDVVIAWCRAWTRPDAVEAPEQTGEERLNPSPGIRNPDTTLLLRRMAALHLDPVTFAREQPVKFRVLQGLCERCETPEQCARDLADSSADPGWQDWRDYCRNATILSALSALEWCGVGGSMDTHPVIRSEKEAKPGPPS